MKIAIGQINTIPSDFEYNFYKIKEFTYKAEKNGAEIIVFPELSLSGYQNQDIIYYPEFGINNDHFLKKVKSLSENIAIVIGHIFFEKRDDHFNKNDLSSLRFGGEYKYYNSASVFYKKVRIFIYHKERLPSFDVFNEERYFSTKRQKKVFSFKGKKIGINICEDIWYENGPYEEQVKSGADIIINISASPFYIGKPEIRHKMISNKAKRFGIPTIYANAVGGQDELIYDGNSMVFNSKGDLIAKGKAFEEELIIIDTDSKEKILFEHNKDEMIFKSITLGIRDYFSKNGIKNAVVGLSGGVDSALVSTLCRSVLGEKNIINVFLPSTFTSNKSKRLVQMFVKSQNTGLITIPISKIYTAYKDELSNFKSDSFLPFENLQSRIRGNILMFIANSYNAAVVATGNKNEIALGYNTLYGDTVGALSPIGDLYKDEVISLCKYINKKFGNLIPTQIIERTPTAELRKNQRDEDDLPPYSITNRLLPEMLEKNRSDKWLLKMGFDKEVIEFVHKAIKRSEFKRRQMPFIIKLKPKSFGMGRRIPITNRFLYLR